jgi:hypothetical protein
MPKPGSGQTRLSVRALGRAGPGSLLTEQGDSPLSIQSAGTPHSERALAPFPHRSDADAHWEAIGGAPIRPYPRATPRTCLVSFTDVAGRGRWSSSAGGGASWFCDIVVLPFSLPRALV